MTADVNVTAREKVARALFEHRLATGDFVDGPTAWDDLPEPWRDEWREGAAAALAALADPDVLAWIAGVLRDAEDEWVRRHADAEGAPPTRSELQAAAVVEWLRGRA